MLCPALAEEFYVGRTIGQGSYGAVRVLKDKVASTVVLCKEFNLSDLDDSGFSSLMYDLSLASHLKSQFLLHYDRLIVYDETSTLFAISSQIGTCSIADLIIRHQCAKVHVPEACILTIMRSVAQALAFLHKEARPLLFSQIGGEYIESPVLHNDLKPSNILVMSNNQILVTDYGTARTYKLKKLTSTFASSLPYIAPEILNRKEPTEVSDIWSLGCVIYELCTLKKFVERANTLSEAISFINDIRDIILPKSYSKHLIKLIKQMLSINEDDRPTVDDILNNKLLESTKPSIHLEYLTGSMTTTYKSASIPNITAKLDTEPFNVITASCSGFGDSSLCPSGITGDSASRRGSRVNSRANSTSISKRNAKSTRVTRSLASSLAFNRSILASSARSHIGSAIDLQDINTNTISSPNFTMLADTIAEDIISGNIGAVEITNKTHRAPSATMADSSLNYLRLLKKNVCAEDSNKLTPQNPYKLSNTLESGWNKNDGRNAIGGTFLNLSELSRGRSVSLRMGSSKLNDRLYITPGDNARISARLPESLRRATSTHISPGEHDTRDGTERMKDFITNSRSKLQLLDSICLSKQVNTPNQRTMSTNSRYINQNIPVTPILGTGQSFSSPSFTIDIAHPDNIGKVTDDLTCSIIETLVPNQQNPNPHVFTKVGLPPMSPTTITASYENSQQNAIDKETTRSSFNVMLSKPMELTTPVTPTKQEKTPTSKWRGLSKRKTTTKNRNSDNHNHDSSASNRSTENANEQINNALVSRLGSSLITKKLHDVSQKKRGKPLQGATTDLKIKGKETVNNIDSVAQPNSEIPSAASAMGPMPIPGVPTIITRSKETLKLKTTMTRSRSKSMVGRTHNEPSEHTPAAPAPPRLSLPTADNKYALSTFLGDNSNFYIESSSSSSTNPDFIFNMRTPSKLQVPKVPQITVQKREHILQNTAMPTVHKPMSSVQHLEIVRSSTTPIKGRTFVPSPPPLAKPHLVEKGRNLYGNIT